MEKVICDVCGIAYPETAAQCPICGCARSVNGQTSACDTVQVEDEAAYESTKGGRFSKNNVRKRLKAQQIQPVPLEMPARAPKKVEPVVEEYEDEEDYDEEDDDEMPASNRGLVIVVVLLLLAIIAVSCYIAIVHFDIFGSNKADKPGRADEQLSTTAPADPTEGKPTEPTASVPCTGIDLQDTKLTLGGNVLSIQLSYSLEPLDTDEELVFTSTNNAVAKVDKTGKVTAVGSGEATITIKCGKISKTCQVKVVMDNDNPDVPDVPVEPEKNYYLRVNNAKPNYPKGDYGCEASFKTGAAFTLKIVDDEGLAVDVTWTASKDEMVVIDGNTIKCYKPGNVTISATYNGIKYSCYAIISGTAIDLPNEEPETPDNPENPENPDEPAEPAVTYLIRIDSKKPNYLYNDNPNSADVTFAATKKFKLTLVSDDDLGMIAKDVEWKLSDDTVCSFDGTYVTCLKKGTCKITAEYKGVTYLIFVRVTA